MVRPPRQNVGKEREWVSPRSLLRVGHCGLHTSVPHLHFLKINMNYYALITDFGKFFLETVFFIPVSTFFFFLNR